MTAFFPSSVLGLHVWGACAGNEASWLRWSRGTLAGSRACVRFVVRSHRPQATAPCVYSSVAAHRAVVERPRNLPQNSALAWVTLTALAFWPTCSLWSWVVSKVLLKNRCSSLALFGMPHICI